MSSAQNEFLPPLYPVNGFVWVYSPDRSSDWRLHTDYGMFPVPDDVAAMLISDPQNDQLKIWESAAQKDAAVQYEAGADTPVLRGLNEYTD